MAKVFRSRREYHLGCPAPFTSEFERDHTIVFYHWITREIRNRLFLGSSPRSISAPGGRETPCTETSSSDTLDFFLLGA